MRTSKMTMAWLLLFAMVALSAFGCSDGPADEPTADGSDAVAQTVTDAPKKSGTVSYEIEYSAFTYDMPKSEYGSLDYHAAFIVRNTGDVAFVVSDYTSSLDFRDADGTLLAAAGYVTSAPALVQPGEICYIFAQEDAYEDVEPTSLTADLHLSVSKYTDGSCTMLEYGNGELSDFYGIPKYVGDLKNTTDEDIDKTITVCCVLLDATGKPLGELGMVHYDGIAAGATIGIELAAFHVPDSVGLDDIASVYTCAYYTW